MSRVGRSLKPALKRARAARALNTPATHAVRAAAGMLGITPEFAIKHLPRSGITQMNLPGGGHARLWSQADDWVSNQIFWRGWDGYEPEVTNLFWKLASSAKVTIDVGSYVGYYTVLGAMANPDATIVALEPLPAAFERLQRNVELNQLNNVIALRLAAGAVDGSAELFHVPGKIVTNSSLAEEFMRGEELIRGTDDLQSIQVKLARIDNLAKDHGLRCVDLVKIDTETTEPRVLAGMGTLLHDHRPDIICEVLPRGADVASLEALLAPLGYTFYLLTDLGPQLRTAISPDPDWLNYLFSARMSPPDVARLGAATP